MKLIKVIFKTTIILFFLHTGCSHRNETNDSNPATRKVYLDAHGMVRWEDTDEEVTLFGVNYCLPSACDYRAAGYVGGERKKMIDQDITHFTRMEFDGIRLCFWGDWQNTDKEGNLIINDHLDILDYLAWKAKINGIYMLFSPIITYNSQWPDALDDTMNLGFSFHYNKWDLGSDPDAINAQVNYLKQLLNHKNPYTGLAYKDEPAILFIEPINEPAHHYNDIPGSIEYINTLVDAIRETGCVKLIFYNVSQDFRMVPAIRDSKVQGSTHAWYPTQLMHGRTLQGNYLHHVDKYDQMLDPGLNGKAKLVYEFDAPDVSGSYMYPAMVRTFRTGGIQFATMFAYDMLATAYANLSWQTHNLNMVYTPNKAVSAIIAARAMRELPGLKSYGNYPGNTRFGDFRVSYEEDLSEYVTDQSFMYSNKTTTMPPKPELLEHIVGCGSSPVVDYEGTGIYFLDKIENGQWKLEVYPDAVFINDPFEQPNKNKTVSRIIYHQWPMMIDLPDLGEEFVVEPLDEGNCFRTRTSDGSIHIRPGIYMLTSEENWEISYKSSGSKKLVEFIAPEEHDLPLQVLHTPNCEYVLNDSINIQAQIVSSNDPEEVTFYIRNAGEWQFKTFRMIKVKGYLYTVMIPTEDMEAGLVEYCIAVHENGSVKTFPGGTPGEPTNRAGESGNWDFLPDHLWESFIVDKSAPLLLFDARENRNQLNFTRIFRSIPFTKKLVPGNRPGKLALQLDIPNFAENNLYQFPMDVSFDHFIGRKIASRGDYIRGAKSVKIIARAAKQATDKFLISLIETGGTAWGTEVPISKDWNEIKIPLTRLHPVKAAMLPQDWPGVNSYWYRSENNKERNNPVYSNFEKVQVSLRQELFLNSLNESHGIEIQSIEFLF